MQGGQAAAPGGLQAQGVAGLGGPVTQGLDHRRAARQGCTAWATGQGEGRMIRARRGGQQPQGTERLALPTASIFVRTSARPGQCGAGVQPGSDGPTCGVQQGHAAQVALDACHGRFSGAGGARQRQHAAQHGTPAAQQARGSQVLQGGAVAQGRGSVQADTVVGCGRGMKEGRGRVEGRPRAQQAGPTCAARATRASSRASGSALWAPRSVRS